MEEDGKYLYAIMGIADSEEMHPDVRGINDGDIYTVAVGEVAAVVSDVPNGKIRPERRNLAAHQAVLKWLMGKTTPLPISFGIIADDAAAVKMILSNNRRVFLEQLQRVKSKVEMGVRVTWDVPNIFEYFVITHPELKALRDRYFGNNHEPTQEQKIELGRTFDRLLNEDREAYTDQVSEILSRYCFEIKENKCARENEVMNLAGLVGRKDLGQFEEGIFEAANLFDNNFTFDFNGPWAPHNFVDISLDI
jgi:hypothetical protein